MKLPRFIASTSVRETGLVRAQDIGALTNVGNAEFRAIEQAGRAIGAVADLGTRAYLSRREIDDIQQAGVATQRVQESWDKAEDAVRDFNPDHDMPLPDDPNYLKTLTTFGTTQRDEFLQSSLKDIDKDATKIFSGIRNPRTRALLIKQYNAFYTARAKGLKGKLNEVLNDYQVDGMGKLARDAALNGNMEVSDFYVDKMAEHGLITDTKATSLKVAYADLAKKSLANSVSDLAFAVWQGTVTKDDPAGDLQPAYDLIQLSTIPAGDKQEIESELKTRVINRRAENKVGLEATQRQQTESVLERVNKKEYSGIDEFIDAQPDLTNAQKIKLKNDTRLHARAELENKAENSPYNQGSVIVFGKLMEQVRNRPESITNPELFEFVGKGLEDGITLGQYNQLSGIHDSKLEMSKTPGQDPLKDASVVRAHSSIGRIRTASLVDIEDLGERRAIEASYLQIQNQLDEYAEGLKVDDPDFASKIEKETKRLLTPIAEEIVLSWFEKLRLPKDTKFFRRLPGKTEVEKLAEKKMEALRKHELFPDMTEQEKASAKKLFEAGRTLNDIIDLLLER